MGIAITVILIIILVIRILYRRRAYAGTVTPPMGSPVAPIAPGGTPVPAGPSPACPTCGRPLNFIGEYQRWYCPAENRYSDSAYRSQPPVTFSTSPVTNSASSEQRNATAFAMSCTVPGRPMAVSGSFRFRAWAIVRS